VTTGSTIDAEARAEKRVRGGAESGESLEEIGRLKLGEPPLKKIASNADLSIGRVHRRTGRVTQGGSSVGLTATRIVLFTGGSENT
jgi:hypothetical protein